MSFLAAFEKRIAADVNVMGDSLKSALHNLEIQAAKVVAACITQHDVTPAAKELHTAIDALKGAAIAAEKDAAGLASADLKADTPAAEQVAVQVGGVVAADIAAHKTENIVPDAEKVIEASPVADQVATQAADIVGAAAKEVVTAAEDLGNTK